jgi:hypothetical protein
MQQSPRGWGQRDIDSLLTGFGFTAKEGGKHRLYKHARLPQVRLTVGRHNDLAVGYVTDAVKAVDALLQLDEEVVDNVVNEPG